MNWKCNDVNYVHLGAKMLFCNNQLCCNSQSKYITKLYGKDIPLLLIKD